MLPRVQVFFVAVAILLSLEVVCVLSAGCGNAGSRGSRQCCDKKDNLCSAFGPRLDGTYSRDGKCYCDESCRKTRDCCFDYERTCRAVDCVVSSWESWSRCSKLCGKGIAHRRRSVVVGQAHSGRACPELEQKRICFGTTNCHYPRHTRPSSREVGRIIPAKFGKWRQNKIYDPSLDIRKNLFHHYPYYRKYTRPGYCAVYEITESKRWCLGKPWAHTLVHGANICVECQSLAMGLSGDRCRGHGSTKFATRWNAVGVSGCHGKWILQKELQDCSCKTGGKDDFLLL